VTGLVDASGAVVERCLYDAYGSPTICDGNWTAITWSNSRKNEVLYCGYRYDPETGNYHVRNRVLAPALGRWAQRDPQGYPDSLGFYAYARTSPATHVDPEGAQDYRIPIGSFGAGAHGLALAEGRELIAAESRSLRRQTLAAMDSIIARHHKYEYYLQDLTGLRAMHWKVRTQLDVRIGDRYSRWTFLNKDIGAQYDWWSITEGGPAIFWATGQQVTEEFTLHEGIHAYEDAIGKLQHDSKTMREAIAYGAGQMEKYLRNLGDLEEELGNAEPNPVTLIRAWRGAFVGGMGPDASFAHERIAADLGFSVSCAKLARFYNALAEKRACVTFYCQPWGVMWVEGQMPAQDERGHWVVDAVYLKEWQR